MLSDSIDKILVSHVFWMYCSLFLVVIFVFVRDQRNDLIKEKKGLENEKQELIEKTKKLNYFFECFINNMRNEGDLTATSLSIIDSYSLDKCSLDKNLPDNFLDLICKYIHLYEQIKKVINEEIKKSSAKIDAAQKKAGGDSDFFVSIVFGRQRRLYQLLNELEVANEKKNGKVCFIDAPDILVEQARKNHVERLGPPGSVHEM